MENVHVDNYSIFSTDLILHALNEPFVSAVTTLRTYNDSVIPTESSDKSLIDLLENAKLIVYRRQARNSAFLGLGVGSISSLFLSKFFGSSNTQYIQKLNNDVVIQNKLLKLTNQRIDILAKNVSNQIETIKTILDMIVESQKYRIFTTPFFGVK